MKICYIANAASMHTEKWVKHFVDLGHEVHVISHKEAQIDGAYVHHINYSLKNFLTKKNEVHKMIKSINPDILHAHQANTCGLYAVTMKGYKSVVSAWGSDILLAPEQSFLMKKIVKYVIKKAEFITSDAHFMSKKIVELGGDENKIYTFPMGIEDNLLNFKREIEINSKAINIISNRRLEKIYNIDIIIEGFARALKYNNNLFLTIAADGVEGDNLKKIVKDLKVENNIKFTGRYNSKDIGKMLFKNDVFISIPYSDSTSVSLLESLCCGVFPIVSDLPANREWVKHGENGLILKETSAKAVEEAILWCLSNKEIMREASSKNVQLIKEKALWKNNVKIVENIYKKIENNI